MGEGAYQIDRDGKRSPVKASDKRDLTGARIVSSRSHRSARLDKTLGSLGAAKIAVLGQRRAQGVEVARGAAEAYVAPDYAGKRWDSCASEAVVVAAGGRFTAADGKLIDYRAGKPEPQHRGHRQQRPRPRRHRRATDERLMLPKSADVVVVGAGIMGLSIAYNLARHEGVRDVCVVDASYLCGGASGRNGGGIRAQWSNERNIRLMQQSLELFREFAREHRINTWFRQGRVPLSSRARRSRRGRSARASSSSAGPGLARSS